VVATSQDNTEEETSSASTPWRPASLTSESKAQNFPNKLHYLLNELEVDGQSHLAYWAKHGRCFFVPNRKEFVEKALCL
jgi:hypothetical protein